jgi:hypothetical protein
MVQRGTFGGRQHALRRKPAVVPIALIQSGEIAEIPIAFSQREPGAATRNRTDPEVRTCPAAEPWSERSSIGALLLAILTCLLPGAR